jgi:uncharacterized lipoprotein YddW (UPF0748 family)
MGAYGKIIGNYTILNESDQNTYIEYIDNHPDCHYDKDNASDKADWRRYQIDLLIELLKEKISEYNKKNSKYIQLGISPTGVYKNGDGKVEYDEDGNAITTGSNTTAGQEHYASYLFCDTLKWCNKGWIDYLLPQSYWAFSHPTAGYDNVMGWWNKVLKYKNVNLYSGIGLYMSDLDKNTYSWKTDYFELYNQLKYVSKSEIILGDSIYNFHTLRSLRDGLNLNSSIQIENGIKAWTKKVPPSEIKSFEKIELEAPKNIKDNGLYLSFDKVEGAKFYIIYQSKNEIKFNEDEIIDIIGNPNNLERIYWKENTNEIYKYGIKTISYTNTLSKGNSDIYIEEPSQEFRAVWSSPWGGDADLITYESEEQFKTNMTYILDTLKMYNMNVLIYHVRTHNDALYESKLNPISRYFEKVNYKEFDPLKWMIDETHKKGIEFHAWMNPYRISSDPSIDIDTILEKYKNYPKNPASKKENILYGTDMIIMNPGIEEVRNFIVDTIIEFLEKYDVEAIHFDDYFYSDMGAHGKIIGNYTILNESDQNTYIEYIDNHPDCPYDKDNASDKADWRRYQVDLLIKLIKDKISEYNKDNSKHIQLGISPTGIYKNGDGKVEYDEDGNAITTGSNTAGQ